MIFDWYFICMPLKKDLNFIQITIIKLCEYAQFKYVKNRYININIFIFISIYQTHMLHIMSKYDVKKNYCSTVL